MHVHFIGVAGSGMASLAGLLKQAGHRVSGSDSRFDPPMGPALQTWGIELMRGYSADHLSPAPDLVIVGNVCTKDHPEAKAALQRGLRVMSMPEAIESLVLPDRPSYVVAGTHGKTTTTALVSFLLAASGRKPGYMIGGIPVDLPKSFDLGAAAAPFVIEGDEYDSAFFEKRPKFWRYRPQAAIVTSVEHDHVDIYPDASSYHQAFARFIELMPPDGVLVVNAHDKVACMLAQKAPCQVVAYGIAGRPHYYEPVWQAAVAHADGGVFAFDLYASGIFCGRLSTRLFGEHNMLNILAALALCAHAANLPVSELKKHLAAFRGVKRRQELLGIAAGVYVYDDFAHHPSAVRATLAAIRAAHPEGRTLAIFEPRSATACRQLHQDLYPEAFATADHVVIAPVARKNLPTDEQLDVQQVVSAIGARAHAAVDNDHIVKLIKQHAKRGDAVVIMSNGSFGGLHDQLLLELALPSATFQPQPSP